jgi:ribonuclease J
VSDTLDHNDDNPTAYLGAKGRIKDALSRFLYDETRRRPIILPVVLEA